MNFIPQEDTYKRKSPGLNGSVSGDFILYFFHESSPTAPLTNRLKIFSYLVAIVPRYSVMDLTPQIKMWYFVIPPSRFFYKYKVQRGGGVDIWELDQVYLRLQQGVQTGSLLIL